MAVKITNADPSPFSNTPAPGNTLRASGFVDELPNSLTATLRTPGGANILGNLVGNFSTTQPWVFTFQNAPPGQGYTLTVNAICNTINVSVSFTFNIT